MPEAHMSLRTLRLAVLDMAGTTIAVSDGVPEAFSAAFDAVGLHVDSELVASVRGRSKRAAIRELLETLAPAHAGAQELCDRIHTLFRSHLGERYAQGTKPIPGAFETIQWLRTHDVPVVLTTGFDRQLARLLIDSLDWSDLVTAIVCDDDVARGRPYPDMILRAMAITGISDPATVLAAGDTAADLIAASLAGAHPIIGVLSGAHDREELARHPHTALLENIAALPDWLQSGA
jgi:phosphonatase-like hydrolase